MAFVLRKKQNKKRAKRIIYSNKKSVRGWLKSNSNWELAEIEKRNPKEGHVYVFHIGDNLYKIGRTYNIQKRLKALQAGNPMMRCVWSAWTKDPLGLERHLHNQMADSLVEREIFQFEANKIMTINRLANNFNSKFE